MTIKQKLKTAVVTGGSQGIGFNIAKILAKSGYNIIVCSRKLSDALIAKKQIELYGVKCLALRTDISRYAECKSLIRETVRNFSRIDLLVNNAAIQGPVGKFWLNDLKDWEKTVAINLMGTVYMSHLVIPYMLKQKRGIILNLSGGGGAYARPLFSAYGSSKTAVLRLTETLAEELKDTYIKVIAIAPGATWTNMTRQILNSKSVGKSIITELKTLRKTNGTPFNKLEKLIKYLINKESDKLSGKLVHVNELEKVMKIDNNLYKESGLLRRTNYFKE